MVASERELWSNFMQGSEADFTLLYHRFAPVLLRYGNRVTKDREMVKDSLQQVFFTLWKSKANLSTPANVTYYLLKAMRSELLKKLSRQPVHEALPEDYCFELEASYEEDLITEQGSEHTKKRLSAVLEKLPSRQREVVFLKYYANLKYEEIASIMGIAQESAYKLNYKALDKLQHLLKRVLVCALPVLFASIF
ncbi:sigma-70 family RNA polymerase sigma factor [Pontibacter sp. E15-1]|uniref:RNA polymerase sigma factor n=1 Tax=Pontibacter sp. E15-1 TaxID=2919918 RepID=UPI001F4F7618|nr:sigma-70 family RNA polymerase sigma factor [Pontibacter sp. E15-1]MCJ8164253.1 sigma-70 family RNA polymerase sigma factor [Pontibacter sp. E15-1]